MRKVPVILGSLVSIVCLSAAARAQEIRGTVRDAETQQPILGAVLVLLDSANGVLGRNLTNDRGQYRIVSDTRIRAIRFLRLGFRPRDVPAPPYSREIVQLDVSMTHVPTLLEPMRVSSGASCSKRDDRLTALSLLEQARAGLLATVVARQNAAKMYRLRFERDLDDHDRPTKLRVHTDRDSNVSKSFLAARPAADFVKLGFRADSATGTTYLGPDAETLLDDAFRDGYCFELAHDRTRPAQIGLRFVPASGQRGRIDIEGTLWIDTTARELRDIQFRYLGLERLLSGVNAGGSIDFRQLANGVTLIDRWFFRLPALRADTSYDNRNNLPVVHTYAVPRELGGEVATAEWRDGFRFQASLGTLRLIALDHSGRPIRNAVVRLEDTDYIGSPDSTGMIEFTNLLPGPYRAMVIDSALSRIGVQVPTNVAFIAERGNVTQRRAQMTTAVEYVRKGCAEMYHHEPDSTVAWLVGRVYDAHGTPANHFRFTASRETVAGERSGMLDANGVTSSDGLFFACGGYDATDFLWVAITDPITKKTQEGRIKAAGRLTVTALRLAAEP